jgi:CBS domain-containing protein
MPIAKTRSVLSGMRVKEAMRRQIVSVDAIQTADRGIARMIKYKADILLITNEQGDPAGIVSKTDMAGAFYAGLPVDTPLGDIMMGPLVSCYADDRLEDALETMTHQGLHQLFVKGADAGRFEGLLTYGDILGLVYRYCRRCRNSHARQGGDGKDARFPADTLVEEVMTPDVISCGLEDSLTLVMEILAVRRMSAVLVKDANGQAAGVISKTDLILAWHRGVDARTAARTIMSVPVRSCHRQTTLTEAMARMLLEDMGRIFVHDPDPAQIVGVLALTDAANQRSGTCRACVSSTFFAPYGF